MALVAVVSCIALALLSGCPAAPRATLPPPATSWRSVTVTLAPRAGVTGMQRVNFAVPVARGRLEQPALVRVLEDRIEIPAARRALARYPDGSVRSVQIQVDVSVAPGTTLEVRLDERPTTKELALVDVSTTLDPADGTQGPKVWALLPANWLAGSGVAGPQVTRAETKIDAFENVCDYDNHTTEKFFAEQSNRGVWLYDRGTTMYRGYVRRGDSKTLESAYRETAIYRAGISGTGAATRISIPGATDDLKYHYAQNLAIHYLLTGDDRFRESAEDIATRVSALWSNFAYAGDARFWTERHAGFSLLAYVWAKIVTDDRGAELDQRAAAHVDAYLAVQAAYPANTDPDARCFAHTAEAHGEDYGTWGCSPWMSAILAEGLDAYATEEGGERAKAARAAIVKLGKIIARDGLDRTGKPYYWMGIGDVADEVDPDDEHWGEAAYVIALAWHHGGRADASLRKTAIELLVRLHADGVSPHTRSFNWQCRSAVAAPYYLRG
ncbi:MAG: hypothetical protein H0V17_34640 [Deltaproteobacteria bacterium]|nr:hypothetical protein [Deltaproteobacteria bacterium]